MNSFIFSLFLSYSFLLRFLTSAETLGFIIGKLQFPIGDSQTSFVIKGKTTYQSLFVIHAVSVLFSVDDSLNINIGVPNYPSQPISQITSETFSEEITCPGCTLGTMNIHL